MKIEEELLAVAKENVDQHLEDYANWTYPESVYEETFSVSYDNLVKMGVDRDTAYFHADHVACEYSGLSEGTPY